ncbi:MAG: BON domain-containing protein [Rhizobiaceae bacterium]|nr:BON domain-containing protein [Rhizobiaceae bacterium]
MSGHRTPKELSREEDYRDYEDRDINDGWPYADGDNAGPRPPQNGAYGDSRANFDESSTPGFLVEETDALGREEITETTNPLNHQRIESDELEAEITERLSVSDVDTDSIDVRVENGIVTLEGSVDTAQSARRIAALVGSIAGVVEVRNRLESLGIDANIPDDD